MVKIMQTNRKWSQNATLVVKLIQKLTIPATLHTTKICCTIRVYPLCVNIHSPHTVSQHVAM